MKSMDYHMPGKTRKTSPFPPFPLFRNAGWLPGKTGKLPLGVSPFPRPRSRGVWGGAKC